MIKNTPVLWYTALFTAWSIDFLFWEKAPGISFLAFILVGLAALFTLSRKEDRPPDRLSLPLAAAVVVFAVLTIVREEPFTRVLNHLAALGLSALLLLTFRNGLWPRYAAGDYLLGGLRLLVDSLGGPIQLLTEDQSGKGSEKEAGENLADGDSDPDPEAEASDPDRGAEREARTGRKRALVPVIRGLLLAVPVLAVLGALLSAADPIFEAWYQDVINLFQLEKLPEYFGRSMLIALWTFLLAGLFLHALVKSEQGKLVSGGENWPPRLLGITETGIILGGVNALFLAFVFIQFRYFFGGEKNISLQGYTYSEYARRGFGELLGAAFFTLFLFMLLSSITTRDSRRAGTIFTGLTASLTAFIGVILVSSLQRLALYEAAYGFTRLRTYSHLCILWIGALFLGLLVLEITRRWEHFTLAAVLAVLGFILTLTVINVDGFIADRNLARAVEGETLDVHYLNSLSADAVPRLIQAAGQPGLTADQQKQIQAELACWAVMLNDRSQPWQSFTLPPYRARRLLNQNRELWEDIRAYRTTSGWSVLVDGDVRVCWIPGWD